MRTLDEVRNEYTMLCAQLGQFEVQVAQTKSKIMDKLAELDAEGGKIKEVQAELEKQKAEAEAKVAKEAAPASEVGATS